MKLRKLKAGDTFKYKGRTITVGETKRWEDSPMLNDEVYQPIEAYMERWKTDVVPDKQWFNWWSGKAYPVFKSASPIANTRKRNDLPPLYIQWKEDYKKRYATRICKRTSR